ncbi:MAG: hypothetical protein HQK82_11210 [Desulfovibrionaceae bacterium]|nr:hypothetical protein [Desulfovibrionaceae bacterium]
MNIFVHKTGVMHAISIAMVSGYTDYAAGQIAPEDAVWLTEKFRRLYGTGWSSSRRSRAKRAGNGVAQLFIHPNYTAPVFDWWLMLTPGPHLAREAEVVYDGLNPKTRLVLLGQYESVQLPGRPRQPTDKYPSAAPSWTWRMTTATYETWQSRLEAAAGRHPKTYDDWSRNIDEMRRLLWTLRRLPGFRGIRDQADMLDRLTKEAWRKAKGESEDDGWKEIGVPVAKPWYVRFKTYPMVDLEFVRQRLLDGKPPFTDELKLTWAKRGADGQLAADRQDDQTDGGD